ncbi:MAG: tRNA lysidine(34) synthetase TilS [Clostridia bacterium]|jgi:tRNA(Ile)-lysidine synthase|nr:tRNA lysidine(34) synthetase TilS [Clostridia bacterium]
MRQKDTIKEIIINTIKEYNLIKNGDNIVIGVSGGPDSIALLDVLNEIKEKFKFNIYVAHINHMIREESKADQEYVKNYCKARDIQCYIKEIPIKIQAKQKKIGTEEAGRIARYEFFEEVLKKTNSNKIATAHNKNDNAETVLMNIIRGSGTTGLKGIEEIRQEKYIRPLIKCTRQEIETYCIQKKLKPCIDKTNKENIYTRNKIRNQLIPYIQKEFNPNIIETLNRLSDILKKENEYLEKETLKTYTEIVEKQTKKEIIINLKKFNQLELVIKNRIVLYTINKLFGTSNGIEKIHIQDIIKLCSNNIGNKYLTPNKKVKILVKDKKIFFIPNTDNP